MGEMIASFFRKLLYLFIVVLILLNAENILEKRSEQDLTIDGKAVKTFAKAKDFFTEKKQANDLEKNTDEANLLQGFYDNWNEKEMKEKINTCKRFVMMGYEKIKFVGEKIEGVIKEIQQQEEFDK